MICNEIEKYNVYRKHGFIFNLALHFIFGLLVFQEETFKIQVSYKNQTDLRKNQIFKILL